MYSFIHMHAHLMFHQSPLVVLKRNLLIIELKL